MTDLQFMFVTIAGSGVIIGLCVWLVKRDESWKVRQKNQTLMKMAVKRVEDRERLMKFYGDY